MSIDELETTIGLDYTLLRDGVWIAETTPEQRAIFDEYGY